MSSAGSIFVSPKTHYARLGHAAQHLLPSFLQEVLLQFENPNQIYINCSRNKFLSRRLKPGEWARLSNAVQHGYFEFDIPLIYSILRNLHDPVARPTRGWDNPTDPFVNEIEIGDDVERCRRSRNEIIHRGNTRVTDLELNIYFDVFKTIADRFEKFCGKHNNEFVFEVEHLKTCCMDEATELMYLNNLTDYQEKDKENEAKISELEFKLSAISLTDSSGNVEISFIETLEDLRCVEGVSVTLQCLLTGPEHQANWYKDGKEILFDKEVTRAHLCFLEKDINVQAYKLIFPKITQAERGTYTLQVGNERCKCFLDIRERTPTLISLRQYQEELAKIALTGQNTIICAGTNSGKTYIAFHIIEDHLIKHPEGKVVFINRTNVLLEQQYRRAIDTFTTLHFQGKIKIWRAEKDDSDDFEKETEKASLIFMTPKSLSNHLIETAAVRVSIDKFTLIILDECHHTHDKSVYNELMSFYRIAKYKDNLHRLPQILGLTASPGTNKAKDVASAKDYLRKVMANLDVSELSVVKRNKEELLQYTSIPEKVPISSTTRKKDPLKDILFDAMEYVEHKLNSRIVSNFLTENLDDSMDLYEALGNPPQQRTDVRYIQWIAETKETVEHVLHKDPKVPRLLHACLRHLELYAECLEINSLLEIDQVRDVIRQGYADESFSSQVANTDEEREIVLKLRDVFADIREIGRNIEGNPDILAVLERIKTEYKELKEESRFIIFVKTRATARALSERLPGYLHSTYLTGSHKSVEEGGRPPDEQIDVLEKFRSGDHLCIVSTSVGCEGLDVPQCNVMIRYRFSADEISSLQMRGRVRKREGREVIVGTTKEFETEMKNIQRQYLMRHAVEEVSKLNIARDIAIAEKNIYEMEELERRTAKIKLSQKTSGLFSVNCKYCGVVITDGDLMRHVNEKMFFVCDNTMLARVDKRPIAKKKQKEFDGFKKQGKAFGLECRHNWGSIIIYKEREFVALSQDYIKIFDRQAGEFINCEKWCDLKFKIEAMSDDDFMSYNTQLA